MPLGKLSLGKSPLVKCPLEIPNTNIFNIEKIGNQKEKFVFALSDTFNPKTVYFPLKNPLIICFSKKYPISEGGGVYIVYKKGGGVIFQGNVYIHR